MDGEPIKPIWKSSQIPEGAVGRPDTKEYLACPNCGTFIDTPGPTIPGTYICSGCGLVLDLDDALDEVLSTLVELDKDDEGEELSC